MLSSLQVGILMYIFTIIFCTISIVSIFIRSKKSPVLYSLFAWQSVTIIWLILGVNEMLAVNNEQLLFNMRLTLIPIFLFAPTWLIFTLYYSNLLPRSSKLQTIFIIILVILPILFLYLPALSPNHLKLLISSKDIHTPVYTQWGIFFYIQYGFMSIYILSGAFSIYYYTKNQVNYLPNMVALIIGITFPWLINVITAKWLRVLPFDLTPLCFSLSNILISYSIFKYKLLDTMKELAVSVFQESANPTLIFNTQEILVNSNLALRRLFTELDINLKEETRMKDVLADLIKDQTQQNQIKLVAETAIKLHQTHTCTNLLLGTKNSKLVDILIMPILTPENQEFLELIFHEKEHEKKATNTLDDFFEDKNLDQYLRPVFNLLVEGYSNADIAKILNISRTTVQNYVSVIYQTLLHDTLKNNQKRKEVIRLYHEYKLG